MGKLHHVGLEEGLRVHGGAKLGCMDGEPIVRDSPESARQLNSRLRQARRDRPEDLRADPGVDGVPVLVVCPAARLWRQMTLQHQPPGLFVGDVDAGIRHVVEPLLRDLA